MKELAFSVQDTPAQQLGATVLHLLGGLTGIGMGIFGKYIASLIQPNTPIARATPALFLSTIYSLGRSTSAPVASCTKFFCHYSWMA